jgi:hypothetical protein
MVVERNACAQPSEIGTRILSAVAEHAKASRFTDDLTVLVLKRASQMPGTLASAEAVHAGTAAQR